MNRTTLLALLLVNLLSGCSQNAQAAEKYFNGYRFEASIVSSYPGIRPGFRGEGSNLIYVNEGQEYSIQVNNPLPVRVAATVTVDGLNTIDGKRTSAADGQKWLIEPYSSITIRGWQTSDSSSRKFIFTRANDSYAKWKEYQDQRDYSANLGIIGVAYFWNSAELASALYPPQPFAFDELSRQGSGSSLSNNLGAKSSAPVMPESFKRKDQAGTGMGRNEWNQVRRINFYYDTGMYSNYDALTIRYQFGYEDPRPLPFEDSNSNYRYRGNYAPEMP